MSIGKYSLPSSDGHNPQGYASTHGGWVPYICSICGYVFRGSECSSTAAGYDAVEWGIYSITTAVGVTDRLTEVSHTNIRVCHLSHTNISHTFPNGKFPFPAWPLFLAGSLGQCRQEKRPFEMLSNYFAPGTPWYWCHKQHNFSYHASYA